MSLFKHQKGLGLQSSPTHQILNSQPYFASNKSSIWISKAKSPDAQHIAACLRKCSEWRDARVEYSWDKAYRMAWWANYVICWKSHKRMLQSSNLASTEGLDSDKNCAQECREGHGWDTHVFCTWKPTATWKEAQSRSLQISYGKEL